MKIVLFVCVLFLAGCGALPKIGGGPTVNTNAQVGKENTQQVVANQENTEVSGDLNTSQVAAQEVKDIRISNTTVDPLVVLLLVLGWLLPSPGAMYKEVKSWVVGFFGLFRRKEK